MRSAVAIRGRLLTESSFGFRIVSLLQLAVPTTTSNVIKCLLQQNLSRRFNPITVPDGAGNLSYHAVSRSSVPQLRPTLTQALEAHLQEHRSYQSITWITSKITNLWETAHNVNRISNQIRASKRSLSGTHERLLHSVHGCRTAHTVSTTLHEPSTKDCGTTD